MGEELTERIENQQATVYRLEEVAKEAFHALARELADMAEQIRGAAYRWEPGLSVQQAAKKTSGYNGLENVTNHNDHILIIVSDLFDAVDAANAANEKLLALTTLQRVEASNG